MALVAVTFSASAIAITPDLSYLKPPDVEVQSVSIGLVTWPANEKVILGDGLSCNNRKVVHATAIDNGNAFGWTSYGQQSSAIAKVFNAYGYIGHAKSTPADFALIVRNHGNALIEVKVSAASYETCSNGPSTMVSGDLTATFKLFTESTPTPTLIKEINISQTEVSWTRTLGMFRQTLLQSATAKLLHDPELLSTLTLTPNEASKHTVWITPESPTPVDLHLPAIHLTIDTPTDDSPERFSLGDFQYGSNCQARRPIRFEDMGKIRSRLLIPDREITWELGNRLIEEGHIVRGHGSQKKSYLNISGTVNDITFEACDSDISIDNVRFSVTARSSKNYPLSRAQVTVSWRVEDENNPGTIFSIDTIGSSSAFAASTSAPEAYKYAIENALKKLMSQEEFYEHFSLQKLAEKNGRKIDFPEPTSMIIGMKNQDITQWPLDIPLRDVQAISHTKDWRGSGYKYSGPECRLYAQRDAREEYFMLLSSLPTDATSLKRSLNNILTQSGFKLVGNGLPVSPFQSTPIKLNVFSKELRLDSCDKRSTSSTAEHTPRFFRVYLVLHWQLTDEDGNIIYEVDSEATGGNFDKESLSSRALGEAFINASRALFSNDSAMQAIQKNSEVKLTDYLTSISAWSLAY